MLDHIIVKICLWSQEMSVTLIRRSRFLLPLSLNTVVFELKSETVARILVNNDSRLCP